jgi:hypothetical protein
MKGKYDTMMGVKLTNWISNDILTDLKQYSVRDDSWFTREVRIGGDLHKKVLRIEENKDIHVEILSYHHFPSEKLAMIRKEKENSINAK